MFSLNLLGGAFLEGPDGPATGRAAHRRRLAVLAVLAAARGRPVARERLIGLLWPEHSGTSARHLLSESLYVLRREIGDEIIVSSGDEIGLNDAVLACDVAAFEGAIEAGELEHAATVYRGPFLSGFYVSDAPEFERWADGERDRLARAFGAVVERLGEACERAGRFTAAVEWWRRLAAEDPFNSRVALRLLRAYDAAGERPGALRYAEAHVALLRDELGLEPDDDFLAHVRQLRSGPIRAPVPSRPASHDDTSAVAPAPADTAAPLPAPPAAPEPAPMAAPVPAAPSLLRISTPDRREPAIGAVERWRSRLVGIAAAAGLALGLAAALLPPRPQAAPGNDPRRIAVLYFDDLTPRGDLEYLAAGITEMLIHGLSQVEALDVVSRNGVKPYRDGRVRFDSMVADLRVGSVVEGSVQRSGDSVRVVVQLIDANTGSHLESRVLVRPMGDILALESAVADEVAGSLRRRLGREVRLREVGAETRNSRAIHLVLQAERLRDDASDAGPSSGPADLESAGRMLDEANRLLRQAEDADPRWARPTLMRGWVALARSRLARPPVSETLLREGAGHAERVLGRDAGSGPAMELLGTARFRLALDAPQPALEARLLDQAERDLRAAAAADSSLAGAWSTLSQLLRYRGRWAEADRMVRRALAQDAFLEEDDDILRRLFFTALHLGEYARAQESCDRGHERFPRDWRFVECRLTLLREDPSIPPDPAAAWALVATLDSLDPPAVARAAGRDYSPLYRRAVAAAILARAGEADSARAVVRRLHALADNDDVRLSLAYDEAYIRLLLGEREAARRLLDEVVARRPALAEFRARDPLFRDLPAPLAATPPRAAGASGPTSAPTSPASPPRSR